MSFTAKKFSECRHGALLRQRPHHARAHRVSGSGHGTAFAVRVRGHAGGDKAGKVGTGWVSVKNSNHFGIAGSYAMMALKNDMIGIVMTNASALVAPTFSAETFACMNSKR